MGLGQGSITRWRCVSVFLCAKKRSVKVWLIGEGGENVNQKKTKKKTIDGVRLI